MSTNNKPYTGKELSNIINSPLPIRNPLIEQLFYEHSVLMIYSDPGIGKSIITLCAMLQAASGHDVFGHFQSRENLKIYYCLGERDICEPAERIQLMQRSIKNINYDNIFIDDNTVGIDVLKERDEKELFDRIERNCPNPDIVVLDPIYCMVGGALDSSEKATRFATFSSRLQKRFHCANWLTNHTVKSTYEIIGGRKEKKYDPFFGSQFLKAHITLMYHVTRRDKSTVIFQRTKDNHEVGLPLFALNFDLETYTLSYNHPASEPTAKDKAYMFIEACKKSNKRFTFQQFCEAISPATPRYSEKLLGVAVSEGLIFNVNTKFEKALYEIA